MTMLEWRGRGGGTKRRKIRGVNRLITTAFGSVLFFIHEGFGRLLLGLENFISTATQLCFEIHQQQAASAFIIVQPPSPSLCAAVPMTPIIPCPGGGSCEQPRSVCAALWFDTACAPLGRKPPSGCRRGSKTILSTSRQMRPLSLTDPDTHVKAHPCHRRVERHRACSVQSAAAGSRMPRVCTRSLQCVELLLFCSL
jgi:hypothetical protein